jgi:hypothetical protein
MTGRIDDFVFVNFEGGRCLAAKFERQETANQNRVEQQFTKEVKNGTFLCVSRCICRRS